MGEDKHEEKALEEEPRHVEHCTEHKSKIIKGILRPNERTIFLLVSGNLFTAYMKGSGLLNPEAMFEVMDEKQGHTCPMCYWEDLEASTYYFLETVLSIYVEKNIVDGHEKSRIITNIH